MSNLIVIRIVPEAAVAPNKFTSYLTALGGLQITANDLSFNNPTPGQSVGSASYIAPGGLTPAPAPLVGSTTKPSYPVGTTKGIVQQYDFIPLTLIPLEPAYFQPESVATAVIEIPSPGQTTFENLRLVVTWGGSQTIPTVVDYYDVALAPGPAPDPNQWAGLPPSLYLQLPAPPATAGALTFTLPSDGTPPAFDSLLGAVKAVLKIDPGVAVPDLGNLSVQQCRNIAYEIVWSQQGPIPTPPEQIENLYTTPPNNGAFLSGTTPNQFEGDRRQFEGNLKGYYALANAAADRLTNYVYALSAAVACEEMSLTATRVLLQFPVNPGSASASSASETEVILTGFQPTATFGVPAAYFYALTATLPSQITPTQRYQMANGDKMQRTLSGLTSAINAGTVTDSEGFVASATPPIDAAQAARRIAALRIPTGSSTPLAPLGTVELLTSSDTGAGNTLPFSSTAGAKVGMSVSGANIPSGTTVSAVAADTAVILSQVVSGDVPNGATVTFTPAFSADLQQLVQAWLAFPPSVSSQIYQSGDDDTKFWPGAATAHSAAFLNLILASLTQGYIVPGAPFPSLGEEITSILIAPLAAPQQPTVATLASLTIAQWTDFFRANPTFLPSFTQPGNTDARIAVFIRYVQRFFSVLSKGPASPITIATNGTTSSGTTDLHFASTSGISPGMTVSGAGIPPGTTVTNVTPTLVSLSKGVSGTVGPGTIITFIPNLSATASVGLPLLQAPSSDWLAECLGFYGAFSFGTTGFDLAKLRTAAAQVFPNDPAAQDWLADALVTLDNLYQILKSVPLPLTATNPQSYEFSLVEALYARGFTSATDVTELSAPDFQQALTGSVAYDLATPIYNAASAITPPPATPGASADGFQPVNPDGSLTNCIPPECLSPLGPIAYLSEMLQATESSTCENPLPPSIVLLTSADTPSGTSLPFGSTVGVTTGMLISGTNIPGNTTVSAVTPTSVSLSQAVSGDVTAGASVSFTAAKTLGSIIAQRRGPLGNLDATCANCETPLPLIDIVNECLEFMGSVVSPTNGIVYDTPADALAGHTLCKEECCEEGKKEPVPACHKPATLFAALPEYSTPATPLPANSAVEPAVFTKLEVDFSSCCLPYSQALDENRTYLRHFRTCRYEVMRTFRKCITEFVLDPANEPAGFQDHLWRYPVRIDIAIEYLGVTPEEYLLLFRGAWPKPCGPVQDAGTTTDGGELPTFQLYGFSSASPGDVSWTQVAIQLPEFLARTCLTYCEFLELWKSGFVPFSNGGDANSDIHEGGAFPDCEPCCLEKLWLQFPEQADADQEQTLYRLAVFVRLWHKLKGLCGAGYCFGQLRDICDVLHLFTGNAINPDFIRQLAAFQIFRDRFQLSLVDPADKPGPGSVDADRTHLLALWVGASATKWSWAVKQMLGGIEHVATCRHKCERCAPEFLKALACNLDSLSRLVGLDPASAVPTDDRWQAVPTHTLRFAEVLAKIYASNFRISEIYYLFTVEKRCEDDGPFPLQEEDEALESPLSLPDDEHEYSLWKLRHKLLEVEISEEDVCRWSWNRIEASLRDDFGYAAKDLLLFGQHFFPSTLQEAGYQVDAQHRRYSTSLDPTKTTTPMWNTPPGGPLQYDATAKNLWAQLPLADEEIVEQLERLQQLNPLEQQAVQDLYFQPRNTLASFAFLFTDFVKAQAHLIEERGEHERWHYFRRQFALCHARCRVLAEHLARHVEFATCQPCPESSHPAFLLLRELFADENKAATDWEDDSGKTPSVTWSPPPNGGAFAALLGLTGTGLLREYSPDGGKVVWRDVCGPLSGFGPERNRKNCPVPSVLPSLGFAPAPTNTVTVRNGLAVEDASGTWLGGAQGFTVKWTGALLIEREGRYEFCAGAPTPECEEPNLEAAEHRQWRVTLKRCQKTWLLLNRHWPGETGCTVSCLPLKRGAYDITVEFLQPSPAFSGNKVCRQHTGFQVKYTGPDTDEELVEIPHNRLFRILKDLQEVKQPDPNNPGAKWQDLGSGITGLAGSANSFLNRCYTSSLRDIRRTYQRAFKALVFAHRFGLSAERLAERQSELGYLLAHPENFAGMAYYRTSPTSFNSHAADFDFNFLPLQDDYYAPTPAQDSRVQPSAKRSQAMFDWWERIFDYDCARKGVRLECGRHLWLLFQEAIEQLPTNPGSLLRHMCAEPRHWQIDLRYYQDQNNPAYAVTSSDLADDRWVVRAWHADRWLVALEHFFTVKDLTHARPDLWASLDPDSPVAAETETGNANLSQFLCDGSLENGNPRRYDEVRHLNDGLRERGRCALLAYLCRMDRVALPWMPGQFATVPRDLSAVLLLDVETGICEKASRIEEAITAVQNFIRRARLDLEPSWNVSHGFARMWDRQFVSFQVWQACKRRHLYKENFVEWGEMEKARRVEAFRFLESELRSSTLSVALPGGLEWWPNERPPVHSSLESLQKREPARLQLLPTPREGLNLLGTPEHDARPSWLTAVLPGSGNNEGDPHQPPATNPGESLPFWMKAAIRLGTRFYRVAASGEPPAAMGFEPHKKRPHEKDCVECCVECGCNHAALVDEYYFWLVEGGSYTPPVPPAGVTGTSPDDYQYGYQDDYYNLDQQQSDFWQEPDKLPQLLEWQSSPIVRLAWCRVHNGKFQQARRSAKGVAVQSINGADLIFQGRAADSLTFSITNPVTPVPPPLPGYLDPSAPGFRYDLATDHAVVLPLVTAPPAVGGPFPGGLPAHPYFLYDMPGTHLFPLSPFSPALAVASALRSHCRFEPALRWYCLAFDPLKADCTWVHCPQASASLPPQPPGDNLPATGLIFADVVPGRGGEKPTTCCDSTDVSCAVAINRSVLLHYLETLRDWGMAEMRRNTPEAFQHARLIFDTAELILGKRPSNVRVPEPTTPQQVSGFKPYFAPLNPRLLDLYDVVRDRLGLIHACLNSRRLHNGKPHCDMQYFGDSPLRDGWRTSMDTCTEESDWCHPDSPYRFLFRIQKAREHAGKVRELGAALLSAFEKGDAEYLAALREGHEREILTLGFEVRKDQWRDADWQIQALYKTKAVNQANLSYYNLLIHNDLINEEKDYRDLTTMSTVLRAFGNVSEGIAAAVGAIPNIFTGVAGFGGTPLFYTQLPVGEPLANIFSIAARIMNGLAEIATSTAGLQLTEAGWQRRSDEWVHQSQILPIEIEQAEQQILGAQRRRDQALQELNSHKRQVEHSAEVQNFLRDKFTSHDLYLFLQEETAALYYQMYELALHTARQAERAFNFERGHTTRRFLPDCLCGTLEERLMAGERLELALHRMETAYLDLNVREYELTKHISLRLHFPMEFLRLKVTGCCEITIPEWMFDLDYPGQYMRRIKNVTLTIPCVAGPYNGVHCRLTLLQSETRIDPRLGVPEAHCCSECKSGTGYEACPHDPRVVRQYAAREAIATSSGQNDSGLFELNFRDDRYLPFEFQGAVSRWRIELPPENNYFPVDTLTDHIFHLNYVAREGGEPLREAASQVAQKHLPGSGWSFFDVRHEFPDAWELFGTGDRENHRGKHLNLKLTRNLFPFIPGHRELWVNKIALLFETPERPKTECCKDGECACPENKMIARHKIRFILGKDRRPGDCEGDEPEFCCVASEDWPELYYGVLEKRLGPLAGHGGCQEVRFRFPPDLCEVSRVFVFCHYEVKAAAACAPRTPPDERRVAKAPG